MTSLLIAIPLIIAVLLIFWVMSGVRKENMK